MNEKEGLSEEVFCLNFELSALANQLIRNSSERWVPGFLYERTEDSHIHRYKLACEFTAGKKIIDVACGAGKGSKMMVADGLANSVFGVDIDTNAVRYAKWRYGGDNIIFEERDAQELGIVNEFDVAVSFETVEHLPDYRSFLNGIKNCLKPDGLFLISTPISPLPIDPQPANPYHIQEWGFIDFQRVIQEFFDIEKVYIQLYPIPPRPIKISLQRQIVNKIRKKILGPYASLAPDSSNWSTGSFSRIEEYNSQYPVNELGTLRQGYQIVLAKAKPK